MGDHNTLLRAIERPSPGSFNCQIWMKNRYKRLLFVGIRQEAGDSVLPVKFIIVVNVYINQYAAISSKWCPLPRFGQHIYPHFLRVAFCKLNFAFAMIIFC